MHEDEIINGKYVLSREIGCGSFGCVWLAYRQLTDTLVALKFTPRDAIASKVIKEARVWANVSGHPNVVSFYDADYYQDYVVLVSDYAPDGSLQDRLDDENLPAPTIEDSIKIVSGILTGLKHIHECGIIHRDIKPANILFKGKTPLLADFGVSRFLESTYTGLAGTPAYMPPEAFPVVEAEAAGTLPTMQKHMAPETFYMEPNRQTDLWSVGVVLYQLLAGHLPFATVEAISDRKRAPEALPANVPVPLRRVTLRALSKEKTERYSSAAEMLAAIQKVGLRRRKWPLYLLIILAFLLLATYAAWRFLRPDCCPPCLVMITEPGPNAKVSQNVTVKAAGACAGRKHYLAVRDPNGGFFVQGEMEPAPDNSLQGTASIGQTATRSGSEFYIEILVTDKSISPGLLRPDQIPSDAIPSNTVNVVLEK